MEVLPLTACPGRLRPECEPGRACEANLPGLRRLRNAQRGSGEMSATSEEAPGNAGQLAAGAAGTVYLVQLPRAEARHLAGVGTCGWPASPEAACLHAVREWLTGIKARACETVPVSSVVGDLELILSQVPQARVPSRGPFAPQPGIGCPPGQVEYLGNGVVRLDEDAVATLAGLGADEDFRVVATEGGPVLVVGEDRYLAREQ